MAYQCLHSMVPMHERQAGEASFLPALVPRRRDKERETPSSSACAMSSGAIILPVAAAPEPRHPDTHEAIGLVRPAAASVHQFAY